MPGQGRLGDKANIPLDAHGCPACPHPGTGPAVKGSANVLVNGRPAVRVSDNGLHAACCGTNTWTAKTGSDTVFINNLQAHRIGDATQHCGGMGKLIEGSANVIVGGSTTSGSGAGASGSPSGSTGGGGAAGAGAEPTTPHGPAMGGAPSGAGGAGAATASAASEPTTFVELVTVDQDGEPVAYLRYEVRAGDQTFTGMTDVHGKARIANLKPGSAEVRFPELHGPDWRKQ